MRRTLIISLFSGKLRDTDSFLAETNDYDRNFTYQGIYIDIFPMEYIPYRLAWIAGHMQGQIYKQLNRKSLNETTIQRNINRIYRFNTRIGFPVLRFFSKMFPVKTIRHSFGTAYFSPRFAEDLFPLNRIEFEGELFPAPHDTHAYLTKIYGDYMKLPDLDKISPHYKEIRFTK